MQIATLVAEPNLLQMESLRTFLPWIVGGIGAWAVLNGVLHDIFILAGEHGKKYDRNLLRLLMDGHILITCGVVMMFTFPGLKTGELWALSIALVCAVSLIVYCAMIWPFLKSVGMMTLSVTVLVTVLVALLSRQA